MWNLQAIFIYPVYSCIERYMRKKCITNQDVLFCICIVCSPTDMLAKHHFTVFLIDFILHMQFIRNTHLDPYLKLSSLNVALFGVVERYIIIKQN